MITWGMVGNSHDASIAVFDRNELKWAGLAKDFSGVAGDPHPNEPMLQHIMNNYGYADQFVWYEQPGLKTVRQLLAGQGWLWRENNIKQYLTDLYLHGVPVKYTQHHLSHAAYAYYTQPHDDCAVICLDSIGEFETLTVWHGKNNRLKKIHSQRYPHSLGLFYSAMTQGLGLVPQQDEYLVADLAKGGDPLRFWKAVCTDIVHIEQDARNPYIRMRQNLHRGCLWWRPDINTEQDLRDLAATTQEIFCWSVKILSNWANWRTGTTHLAVAGGGAMNRDAVSRITSGWDTVWVPPRPGDPGSAVGCVLAHSQHRIDNIGTAWH